MGGRMWATRPIVSRVDDAFRHVTGLGVAEWHRVSRGTIQRSRRQRLALVAAGWAFWAAISLFPSLIVLITVYGLLAEAEEVQRQVGSILGSVSSEVRTLITRELRHVVRSSGGWGLVFGLAALLWTASSGMANAIKAVALAYGEAESRSFLRLRALALLSTVGALLVVGSAIALVAIVPATLSDATGATGLVVGALRWGGLIVLLTIGITILYRFSPRSRHGGWHWAVKAAVLVSIGWAGVTATFSVYIRSFSSYANTYGALAGFIILMLWLYLSAFLVVTGAAVGAEMWRVGENERDAAR
jgi:membrane protein